MSCGEKELGSAENALPNPNCSLKLRERDGTLWEAFHTNEETQYLYDDIPDGGRRDQIPHRVQAAQHD